MSKKNAISELLNDKDKRQEKQKESQYSNTDIQETGNTDIQQPLNTAHKSKKKATFLLDEELHKKLKVFAASRGENMVDIIEDAVKEYMQNYS